MPARYEPTLKQDDQLDLFKFDPCQRILTAIETIRRHQNRLRITDSELATVLGMTLAELELELEALPSYGLPEQFKDLRIIGVREAKNRLDAHNRQMHINPIIKEMTTMATKITIKKLDTETRHPLFHHYDGQLQSQPAYLQIDLESGETRVGYSEEIGGGVPERVWNNVVLRYRIAPDLTTYELNRLLDEIEPLAKQLLAGADCRWDNSNWRGFLDTAEADDANYKIERICETQRTESGGVMDAFDFFQDWDDSTVSDLIAADTDKKIKELAEWFEDDNDMTITGIVERLTEKRDELAAESA